MYACICSHPQARHLFAATGDLRRLRATHCISHTIRLALEQRAFPDLWRNKNALAILLRIRQVPLSPHSKKWNLISPKMHNPSRYDSDIDAKLGTFDWRQIYERESVAPTKFSHSGRNSQILMCVAVVAAVVVIASVTTSTTSIVVVAVIEPHKHVKWAANLWYENLKLHFLPLIIVISVISSGWFISKNNSPTEHEHVQCNVWWRRRPTKTVRMHDAKLMYRTNEKWT